MEKRVYLWELDSVRNSKRECELARQALYQALLEDENVVVMTFNQLADARWMLPILEDQDNYGCLMQLFKMGVIRVSHYKDIRTASQYMQNALEKALDEESDFIFSGMPVKKEERYLLQEILNAVRYCDPERIQADIEDINSLCDGSLDLSKGSELFASIIKEKNRLKKERKKVKGKKKKEKVAPFAVQVCTYYYMLGIGKDPAILKNCLKYEMHRLLIIYRYVKLILLISEQKTVDNAPVEKSAPLKKIIKYVLRTAENMLNDYCTDWAELFENAVKEMREMPVVDKDKRSCWYEQIDKKQDLSYERKQSDFQKLLVDVCYNFTLESSIDGVYCAYDDSYRDFVDAFIKRMDEYYDLYKNKIHYVNKAQTVELDEKDTLDWKCVAEIRKDILEYEKHKRKSNRIEKMKWSTKVRMTQIIRPMGRFFFCFSMFFLLNLVSQGLEDGFEMLSQNNLFLQINMWWQNGGILRLGEWCRSNIKILPITIFETVVFGLVASCLENRFGIPDIRDIFRNFSRKLGNWRQTKKIMEKSK